MPFRLIKQVAGGNALYSDIPVGQYSRILVEVTGTSQSGKTAAVADMPGIILTVKGQQKVNISFAQMQNYDYRHYGVPQASAVSGGAFQFDAFYYCKPPWKDKASLLNVLNVSPGDITNIQLSAGGLGNATNYAGATVSLYVEDAVGVQTSITNLISKTQAFSGNSDTETLQITDNAFTEFEFDSVSSLLSVQLLIGGKQVLNEPATTLLAESNEEENMKTAQTFAFVELNHSKSYAALPIGAAQLQMTSTSTSGAFTQSLYYAKLELTPQAASVSAAVATAKK
ncbi:MAG: hypothetical protein JRN15_04875 [Nitrososphaerota archaeon]|nr:hypothetical protein [Nitrososphaerota archaeon]